MDEFLCHSLKNIFSPVMNSCGGPDMVNGLILHQNTLQHGDSFVVNFGLETKYSSNWCAQES